MSFEAIIAAILGMFGAVAYFDHKRKKTRQTKSQLYRAELNAETRKAHEDLAEGVKLAREKRKSYEKSKKYFRDKHGNNKPR